MSKYKWTKAGTGWYLDADDEWITSLDKGSGEWRAWVVGDDLPSTDLREIARKLDELNGETK